MFRPVSSNIDFSELENKLLKHWYDSGIVTKYLQRNNKNSKQRFSFLDGPITANNPMGVHHAWGRTYKDLWQRFWNMRGYQQRFQNGFDCQGLWVEVEVEKELGLKSKKDIENLVTGNKHASIAKFIEQCKQRVLKYASIQTEQSKRLGYFMDWEHSYFTMSEVNNYMIWHFLKKCHQLGYLYKGKDSVPWCPRCGTAISQHEMLTEDYKEVTHDSVFFKLPLKANSYKLKANMLAWTTTPWTIPANVALAVHPDFTYGIYENQTNKEHVIFVVRDDQNQTPTRDSQLIEEYILSNLPDRYTLINQITGSKLIGLKYQGPFDQLNRVEKTCQENSQTFHTVINGKNLVTSTEGTGVLHVAPGAGQEDFQLGKQENLPVINVIDEEANYLKGMGEFTNLNAKNEPEIILKYLKIHENGKYWLKKQKITHRYPACWRCKTELVWRVVDEWYIAMDQKPKTKNQKLKTLREQMIAVANQITWMPDFGLKRELDWLNNMHDWLISKKRYWGLALPIWECGKCRHFEVIGSREELKQKAISGWETFSPHTPHRPYIDEIKINCPQCGSQMARIPDVGNPWLDAGIVPYSTITEPPPAHSSSSEGRVKERHLDKPANSSPQSLTSSPNQLNPESGIPHYLNNRQAWQNWFPADFITESFPGQFKNWFYSMIAMSTVLENQPPYKRVLGFGTLLAEDGRAMHKSWGNSIEFNQGADEMGVDVMRFMYALANPADNMLFGPKGAGLIRRKFLLILWNVYNFFITYANTDNWQPTAYTPYYRRKTKRSYLNQITNSSTLKSPHMPVEGLKTNNILDTWILTRLHQTTQSVTQNLENYQSQPATQALLDFVDDLSTWYVRRSRTRLGPTATDQIDKQDCYETLYQVLTTLSKLIAPITPFIADEIYTNLTGEQSVHLANWPAAHKKSINNDLLTNMELSRKIVTIIHANRKLKGINIRQPLKSISYDVLNRLPTELEDLILSETNIKNISHEPSSSKLENPVVTINWELTPELKAEGQAREIIRQIQIARKEANCQLNDKITVQLPDWPKDFENLIKHQTLTAKLVKGKKLNIIKR